MLNKLFNIKEELMLIVLGILLYNMHYVYQQKSILTNIVITSFVLAVFDVFLKKILLFNVNNNYYKFVINNVITIVVIDYLIYIIKGISGEKSLFTYLNLAFACFFYETVVFKLYNYNNLCNQRLRNITKTIMRLATIHVLSNVLNQKEYDKEWFSNSFSQIFNFSLYNTIFYD